MQYEEIEWVVGEGGDWGVFGLGGDLFKYAALRHDTCTMKHRMPIFSRYP